MDEKVKAIVAHITPIGWIIALIVNINDKDEYTSFYLRQTLGLYIISLIANFIPFLGWIVGVVVFAFWLLSLIYAIQGERKNVPFGHLFQEWFNGL
ncbi:MAG: hypothetical protein PF541_18715 [Prolixibacteraceae bacterium]|jgi:uncharacterized membrane protein|nr:hypothetical protein [Prolixibacteraceae bacterium]